jgi:hypothetical protein
MSAVGLRRRSGPRAFVSSGSEGLLLDDLPAPAMAVSFRHLRTAYTGDAARIRNTSGGSIDYGFVDGYWDRDAVIAEIGSNSARVVTLFDQSGNGNDCTATGGANQPTFINAGTPFTSGGRDVINFDGANDRWEFTRIVSSSALVCFVVEIDNDPLNSFMGNQSGEGGSTLWGYDNTDFVRLLGNGTGGFFSGTTRADSAGNLRLFTLQIVSGSANMYINGSLEAGGPITVGDFGPSQLGSFFSGSRNLDGRFAECIYWDEDQSSNREAIEANISAFYTLS